MARGNITFHGVRTVAVTKHYGQSYVIYQMTLEDDMGVQTVVDVFLDHTIDGIDALERARTPRPVRHFKRIEMSADTKRALHIDDADVVGEIVGDRR